MTRRQALEHMIWQEENLFLWKPKLFNIRKLNKLKRELQELDNPQVTAPDHNPARAVWPPRPAK